MIDNVEFSRQGQGKWNHFYSVFLDVFFDQKAGEDCHAQSLGNASDDGLRTGALPERTHSNLPESKAGVQDLPACTPFLAHEKRIFGKLLQSDLAAFCKRMVRGDDRLQKVFMNGSAMMSGCSG